MSLGKVYKEMVQILLDLLQPGLISNWVECAKFGKIAKHEHVVNFDNFTTECREP